MGTHHKKEMGMLVVESMCVKKVVCRKKFHQREISDDIRKLNFTSGMAFNVLKTIVRETDIDYWAIWKSADYKVILRALKTKSDGPLPSTLDGL